MKTRDAVSAFNAGRRSPEITEALAKFDKGLPIWKEGAPLDMVEALEVREHIEGGGQPPSGHVTSAELCAVSKKRIEADPSVRGVSLFKGVSTDAAQMDWNGITTDQRLLVALGVDTIHPSGPSIAERRAIVQMLKSATLPPEWQAVKKRLDKMTAGQKEALESERLYVQAQPVREEPRSVIQIERSIVQGDVVAGNKTTPQAGGVPLLLLYSASDMGAARDLTGHMFPMKRAGVVDLMDWHEIRAGEVVATERARMLGRAKIVVPLITSNALADSGILDAIDRAVERSARITPILVSDCLWTMMPWKDLVTMPRERKFISAWSDRNAAWAHCVEHLRALAMSLR